MAFLGDLVADQPRDREINVTADNLSALKTQRVRNFLTEHTSVCAHYPPSYSSWLDQVEIWFAKIQRDVIARGVFTSVEDLSPRLMR